MIINKAYAEADKGILEKETCLSRAFENKKCDEIT